MRPVDGYARPTAWLLDGPMVPEGARHREIALGNGGTLDGPPYPLPFHLAFEDQQGHEATLPNGKHIVQVHGEPLLLLHIYVQVWRDPADGSPDRPWPSEPSSHYDANQGYYRYLRTEVLR